MPDATIRAIEQFLYREARLLDSRQYHAWLDLLADDVRYWMPVRTSRYAKISKSVVLLDEAGYDETDIAGEDGQAIMDEDKTSLQMRVARLDTGMAWAEDPPSLTRHFLSNIEVEAGDAAGEFRVFCNFIVYRSRGRPPAGFLRGAARRYLEAAGRRAIPNRPPQNRARPKCVVGQKCQHVFFRFIRRRSSTAASV